MEIIFPHDVQDVQKFLACAGELDYDEFSAVSNCVLFIDMSFCQ